MLHTFETTKKYSERRLQRHQLMMEMQRRCELSSYLPNGSEVVVHNTPLECSHALATPPPKQATSLMCAPKRCSSLIAMASARQLIHSEIDDDDQTFVFSNSEGEYPGLFRARPYQDGGNFDVHHAATLHDISMSHDAADNREQPLHGGFSTRFIGSYQDNIKVSRRRCLGIVVVVTAMILAIACIGGLTNNAAQSIPGPSLPIRDNFTTSKARDLVSTLLMNVQVLEDDYLFKMGSAQNRAVNFLSQTDLAFALNDDIVIIMSEWTSHPVIRPLVEAYVLAVLFFSTSGDGWTNSFGWNDPKGMPCQYHGVECSIMKATDTSITFKSGSTLNNTAFVEVVTNITLTGNHLEGSIPTELGFLYDLVELDLSINRIGGDIPSALASLEYLESLRMHDNELVGSLPKGIFETMQSLSSLVLYHNFLTGSIPRSIAGLFNLEELLLSNNRFTGVLPLELGALNYLHFLRVGGNRLVGEIPETLGNIAELWILDLADNKLNGTIPSSLAKLPMLVELHLHKNKLTGTIPENIEGWKYMTVFDVELNDLFGTIPPFMCELGDLRDLQLSRNQLSGSLPDAIGNLTKLQFFRASQNILIGQLPDSLGTLTMLEVLHVGENQFSGVLPESLSHLSSLTTLEIHANGITGSIPASVCSLRHNLLESLTADCYEPEVVCECCTSCF